ncbi:DUF805 domain-containing protein [Flavobacterium sp.]|uniref:DUF805 domain-containing protein n=1 Tax=Flavobacterium sp. TaxID=239 RepID=UPI00403422B5
MEWYLKVMRDNYANFSGRARRSEYWYFTLFNVLAIILLALLGLVTGIFFVFYLVYIIAMIIPSLAVSVRRLHDTGKSGWFILLGLVPLGGLVLLVFYCIEGDRGSNEYGPDPKNDNYNEFDDIGMKQPY